MDSIWIVSIPAVISATGVFVVHWGDGLWGRRRDNDKLTLESRTELIQGASTLRDQLLKTNSDLNEGLRACRTELTAAQEEVIRLKNELAITKRSLDWSKADNEEQSAENTRLQNDNQKLREGR